MNGSDLDKGPAPWDEYRRVVLRELAGLSASLLKMDMKMDLLEEKLEKKIDILAENIRKESAFYGDKRDHAIRDLEVSVAMLQVKSGMWGAIAGSVGGALVGAVAAVIVEILVRGHQ